MSQLLACELCEPSGCPAYFAASCGNFSFLAGSLHPVMIKCLSHCFSFSCPCWMHETSIFFLIPYCTQDAISLHPSLLSRIRLCVSEVHNPSAYVMKARTARTARLRFQYVSPTMRPCEASESLEAVRNHQEGDRVRSDLSERGGHGIGRSTCHTPKNPEATLGEATTIRIQ